MRAPDITHIKVKHGRCSICGHHGDDCTGSEYPEHDRLKAVSEYSQQIGQFLDWLKSERVFLSREHHHSDDCFEDGIKDCGFSVGDLAQDYERIEDRLARYFEIDLKKIETEKREMLASLRVSHANREIRKELALEDK